MTEQPAPPPERRIDYVLAYHIPASGMADRQKEHARLMCITELKKQGIEVINENIKSEYTKKTQVPPKFQPWYTVFAVFLLLLGLGTIGSSMTLWYFDRKLRTEIFLVWAGAPMVAAGIIGFISNNIGRPKWAYLFLLLTLGSAVAATLGGIFTGMSYFAGPWGKLAKGFSLTNCSAPVEMCECNFLDEMPIKVESCEIIPVLVNLLISEFALSCVSFVLSVITIIVVLISLFKSWMDGKTGFFHLAISDAVVKRVANEININTQKLRDNLFKDDESEPQNPKVVGFGRFTPININLGREAFNQLKSFFAARDPFEIRDCTLPRDTFYTEATIGRSPIYKTDTPANDPSNQSEYPPVLRSSILYFILENLKPEHQSSKGVAQFIQDGIFVDAYPVHENMRLTLQTEWASMKRLIKRQPLTVIKDYLGHKVGFFFAWYGFLNAWLVVPDRKSVV